MDCVDCSVIIAIDVSLPKSLTSLSNIAQLDRQCIICGKALPDARHLTHAVRLTRIVTYGALCNLWPVLDGDL